MYAITSSDCKLDRDFSANYGHSNTLVEYICGMLHYYFRDQKGLRSSPLFSKKVHTNYGVFK